MIKTRHTSPLVVAIFMAIGFSSLATIGRAETGSNLPDHRKKKPAMEDSNKMADSNKMGSGVSAKDKEFMMKAAMGGMKEVDMGKMAEQQGKSDDVKKIGSRMVADHGKANSELMAIAAKKGVTLGKNKAKMAKLDEANFDKEYLAAMVKDHEKDLAEFQSEAQNGSDPDVKAFAAKTAKVIESHLAMIKAAQKKMK